MMLRRDWVFFAFGPRFGPQGMGCWGARLVIRPDYDTPAGYQLNGAWWLDVDLDWPCWWVEWYGLPRADGLYVVIPDYPRWLAWVRWVHVLLERFRLGWKFRNRGHWASIGRWAVWSPVRIYCGRRYKIKGAG